MPTTINKEVPRPADFTSAPIPMIRSGTGWVQWVEVSRSDRASGGQDIYYEIEGAEISGDPIEPINLSTRVVRADEVETSADFIRRIFAELDDIVYDRWTTAGRFAETLPVRAPSEQRALASLISTGNPVQIISMASLNVIHATFALPNQAQAFGLLPQNKKRKGGLWIPAKRTRSNAVAFTRIRVPHK